MNTELILCTSTHIDCEAPSTTVTTTKEELLLYFKQMYTMRRMEIVNDTEYKVFYNFLSKQMLSLCLSCVPRRSFVLSIMKQHLVTFSASSSYPAGEKHPWILPFV